MRRTPHFLALALAVSVTLLANTALADDAAPASREQLQQAADQARAARDAASDQLSAARMAVQQLETDLLEARRAIKQAEQDQKGSESRLPAEQEAAKAAAEAKQNADQAQKAAEEALAGAKEALKPDLPDDEIEAAEKAIAEAQQKLDDATKTAIESTAKAEAAQQTVDATQKALADAKAASDAGNKQVEELQSRLDLSRKQAGNAEEQLAAATGEWVTHQRALELDLRNGGEWVSFTDDVAPVLHGRCIACHNTKTAKGRLNLTTYASLMKGGESGAAVDPGDGELSNLCMLIEDGSMPQDADPLKPEQIALVKRWVELGAKLDAGADPNLPLIRVMPKPEQPPAPESYRVAIPVTAIAFSPDGSLLASSGYHEVLLWKTEDGTLVRRIGNVAERIYDLEFHRDGQLLAIAAGTPGQLGEVRIVNVTDGTLVRDMITIEDAVFAATFSPDGTRLAAAGADRAIRLFNVETGAEEVLIEDHADWVMSVAWSPDGSRLASASRDKTSKLFDAASGDAQVTFNGHGDVVFGVGFLPDGQSVATTGADNEIRTWSVEKAEQKQEIKSHGGDVFQIQVLPDGQALTCSEDKTARLHNLGDGKELRKFAGHAEWVYAAAVHPETKRVATGSYDGEIRLWNLEDGAHILTFRAAPGLEQVSTDAAQ